MDMLSWSQKLRIGQPFDVMIRLLAPTCIALVLCIASVASQQLPAFVFPDGIQYDPDHECGLKLGVDTYTVIGNLTGITTNYSHLIQIKTRFSPGFYAVRCTVGLSACGPNPTQYNPDNLCYCSGTSGGPTDPSTVYHLNITLRAKYTAESRGEVQAVLPGRNINTKDVKLVIGNLPVVYEEVVTTIEVKTVPELLESESGQNLWMMLMMTSPNVTFITSSPTVELQFCAKHLQPGHTVKVDGALVEKGLTNDQQCVTKTMARPPSAVSFEYTQPDNSSCDTGKTFHVNLAAPEPATTTESTNDKSNGCQLLMINKFWIAALTTATLLLAC